jgi:hypothetical protein
MDWAEIKNKANSIFVSLFPNIKCEEPYIESETLFVPFTWNTLSKGLMVFSDTGIDAFRCRPFQFENPSVDWIKMKYLTREPAIAEMEEFLRPLNYLIAPNIENRRPRT